MQSYFLFQNWYICAKTHVFLPSLPNFSIVAEKQTDTTENEKSTVMNDSNSTAGKDTSDSTPLLHNSENYTEMREFHQDYISTITTYT